jgi:integrase
MHTFAATEPSPLNPKQKSRAQRLLFTKNNLDDLTFDLQGPKGWQWYYDERTPGLAIGISKNGIKSFYLIRKIAGRAKRLSLGRYPTVTIETARREAQNKNQLIAQRKNPEGEPKDVMRFPELFNRYMEIYARKNNKTAEAKVVTYKRYLATDRYRCNLGKMALHEITGATIEGIFNGVSSHAPVHANRVLALLRSIFNKAINWKLWTELNPCSGIERNAETSRERVVNKSEMPYLLTAIELEPNETLRDFVKTALLTGARRSNVLAMRYEDVDYDERLWRIPETKNGSPHIVPMVPTMIDMLKARQKQHGTEWVFPSTGATGHYVEPKKGWKVLLARATVLRLVDKLADHFGWDEVEATRALTIVKTAPENALKMYSREAETVGIWLKPIDMRDIRIHDLRRTLGSWQADANVSEKIIGKTLGHLSQQSTKVYARVSLAPVRDAMILATNNMLNVNETHK